MAVFLQLEGLTDYAAVHALQQELVAARAAGAIPDVVLLLEHAETITVGRGRDAADNVLLPGDVPVVRVERGGDVTWHGPGQLVAYPILKLEGRRADLHLHLHSLEDAVIALLAELDLPSGRDDRNTGVWVEGRKVCSIGIACRKWVSWHGLALNVTPDLASFAKIRPCGFDAGVMTRLVDYVENVTPAELAPRLAEHLGSALEVPVDAYERVDVGDVRGRLE